MKSYLKTTAGVVLSATMATASYGATVNVGELQGFTGPLESMIGAMSGGANLAVTEANASGAYLQGTINVYKVTQYVSTRRLQLLKLKKW